MLWSGGDVRIAQGIGSSRFDRQVNERWRGCMFASAHCTTRGARQGISARATTRIRSESRAAVLRAIGLAAYVQNLGCAHTGCARRPPITFLASFHFGIGTARAPTHLIQAWGPPHLT